MEYPADTNRSEEEFFFRDDQQKLKELRRKLDEDRQQRLAQQQKEQHWMKCPKCGNDMVEIDLRGVMVDKCTGCQGVFFDKGEWSLIMDREEEEKPSFLTTLHHLIGGDARI